MKCPKLFVFVILFLVSSIYVYAQNTPPIADAGVNRNVIVNEEAILSGSGTDAEGDALTFKWQLIDKPGGSLATLTQDNVPNVSFTPDLEGPYSFNLRTNDGQSFSTTSNIIITASAADTSNSKPISDSSNFRNVNVGEESIIPAIGSDDDRDDLIYIWYIAAKPQDSKAILSNSNTQSLQFKPDIAGSYILALIVNDGKEDSDKNVVNIMASSSSVNRAPTADAGPTKTIKLGDEVTLAGTGSDPDKDTLRFTWAVVSKPLGSQSILLVNDLSNSTFTPDVEGDYTFSLTVNDVQLDSQPDVVTYTAKTPQDNNKPTANAGNDRTVNSGEEIILQGAGTDTDKLTYRWSIISVPGNSGAFLSNPNVQKPKFIPEVVGDYIFQLITHDGREDSNPDTIDVNVVEAAQGCVQGTCDLNAKRWCDNGEFTSTDYCIQCGNLDSSCPTCSVDACDVGNQRFCDGGIWSAIDYCDTCGLVDASCDVACSDNTCDTSSRQWCNDGVWDNSNYCLQCSGVDDSCSVACSDNACDTSSRQWCNDGVWDQTDYCNNCGSEDVSCGLSCQSNVCDTTANRWCNVVFWATLNYCDHCQDSECLGTCVNDACDANTKQWCDKGSWTDVDYCQNCGNIDSSCSTTCEEGVCDTTANKVCSTGVWTSRDYCDTCGLEDRDCSIACAEGECDIINKQVCTNGNWTSESYSALCAVDELNITTSNETDINVTIVTCNDQGNCAVGRSCDADLECSSGFCSDNECREPTCNDGIKNQDEVDVDCSGPCTNKCDLSQACNSDSDCGTGLECSSQICSEIMQELPEKTIPPEEVDQDKDNDGIPDEWEIQYGLNPDDASDSNLDFDQDGLTNIQEYTFGTNPNRVDSDRDGVSDKEEIDKGTDPLDADDKPGGIFGVIFTIFLLIIILVGGGYGAFYYLTKFKVHIPRWLARYIPQKTKEIKEPMIFTPRRLFRPSSSRDLQERKKEIVEERRKEKREKREEILKVFGKKGLTPKEAKEKKRLISMSKEKSQIEKSRPGKEEVFSKLKQISKRRK